MTKLKDIIEKTAIDSYKIIIDIEMCIIINKSLLNEKYLINTDFEILQTIKDKSLQVNENGIKTKFSIVEYMDFKTNTRVKKIAIQANAKLLKDKYLIGINRETLPIIHDEIIKMNIVHFDYEELLNAKFIDCDLKIDYLQTEEQYKEELNDLYTRIEPSKNTNTGGVKHENGLRANERHTPHYKSNPHILIYSKGIELKSNKEDKKEFTQNYLLNVIQENAYDIDKLRRIEATINNGRHFKHITGEENTIKNLLEVIEKEPLKIHYNHINRVFKLEHNKRNMNELTATEKAIFALILMLKGFNMAEPEILSRILSHYEIKQERHRIKSLILKIFTFIGDRKQTVKPSDGLPMRLIRIINNKTEFVINEGQHI